MKRDSYLYKIRRKCQVIARHIIPLETLSKFYFRIVMKRALNLKNPKSFNEKLQWLKLYYCPAVPLIVKCSDKHSVRDYVESKGLKHILVKSYGVWENANEINWGGCQISLLYK